MAWVKGREPKAAPSPQEQRRARLIEYREAIIARTGEDSFLLENPIFRELDNSYQQKEDHD